jgi:hypothetical protein
MNAAYTVKRTSHGWALVLNFANGEGELIGYFPTKAEADDTRLALNSLRTVR